MAIEVVVFDWDGTLVDSTGRIVECLTEAARDTGMPDLGPDRYRAIIGLGLPEALQALYPEADQPTRDRLRARYAHHYIAADAEPCAPYPGAVGMLEALRARGLRLAVATGKNRPGLERAFRGTGLAGYFQASRTADETRSKPDPRMLDELLAEFGVAPSAALMVGDTAFDLDMARRASVDAIGVTHGAHDADELLRYNPLALIDHLDEVAGVLDSLPRRRGLVGNR